MVPTLEQRLAQLAIPLVAAAILSSCASDGLVDGLGKPLPQQGEIARPAPYDPFGSGQANRTARETEKAPSQGFGARPQNAQPPNEGQNTVSKTQMAAVAPPAAPRASSSPIDGNTALSPFAGLSADELRARWGSPSLTRTEAGAQLWQFQGKGCVVLAYLYPSANGGLETAFAEAHPGGDSANAVSSCLGKSMRTSEAGTRTRKPELMVKPD